MNDMYFRPAIFAALFNKAIVQEYIPLRLQIPPEKEKCRKCKDTLIIGSKFEETDTLIKVTFSIITNYQRI